jgi:uncharacterized protein YraI
VTIPVQVRVEGGANLNVRSQPSPTASILTRVPSGTELAAIGRTADSQWLLVRLADNTQGWVAVQFVTAGNDVGVLPVAP